MSKLTEILDQLEASNHWNKDRDDAAKQVKALMLELAEQAKEYADEECSLEEITSTGASYMSQKLDELVESL